MALIYLMRPWTSTNAEKELFHVFFLPDHQNSSHRKHAAGAFLDFLSVRILKLCSMYFDFQKIERKKSKQALF